MDKTINIGQIMTTEVLYLHPEDIMDKVKDIFNKYDFHHLPVVNDNEEVVGIISKTDYFKLQHTFTMFKRKDSKAFNQAIFRSLLVKEVMTDSVVMLQPEESIQVAMGVFRENLFHAIPIVNEQKKLLGILSTYDLLNYAFKDEMLLQ